MSNTEKVHRRNETTNKEEVLLLSFLIDHLNDRLKSLKPGINCTSEQYAQLTKQKLHLTICVNERKLDAKGLIFEKDSVFVYNNVVLKLGGIYQQKLRA